MRDLPTGTVTLLFSDMESSTRMVHALGAAWPAVLDQQRELCRAAWSAHGGVELGTEGDSFFVAFASAAGAVAAAVAAQRSIASATWPPGADVRVRVGIHTGTPQRHRDGYVGLDVHRAARIAGCAHGGQVVVSEATWRRAGPELGDGVDGRDLGEHRLRDLPARTRLFQVTAPGTATSFPPVRSLGGVGYLPGRLLRPGGLVGRDREVAALTGLLADGARLVTLTGPGGVGKTALAAAVAAASEDHPDGVFVVPMAGASSADGMWAAMSQVLDVPPDGQVPPGFFDYLAGRRLLLVLDNLEQIADAPSVVRELLDEAPHVTVLATSRRPLHLADERELVLEPLDDDAAVALFERRARPGRSTGVEDRDDVARLCAALDRLPLGIEIAAARTKMLSPRAILARIDSILDLASTDPLREDRQSTLRRAVAWSYDLLDEPHRVVLDHLGVFVDGASLEAIAAVVPAEAVGPHRVVDLLFDLVDDSLVSVVDTDDGEPRFGLLETIRRFADDRLRSTGRHAAACDAHARCFHDVAVALGGEGHTSYGAHRRVFLRELGNLEAAAERTREHADRVALLALRAYEYRRYVEATRWCRLVLDAPTTTDPAALHRTLGMVAFKLGEVDGALAHLERAWSAADGREVPADRWLPGGTTPADVAAEAAHVLGAVAAMRGDRDLALAWCDRLAAVTPRCSPLERRRVLDLQYFVALHDGDLDAARSFLRQEIELVAAAGATLPFLVNNLAYTYVVQGDHARAQELLAAHVEATVAADDPESTLIVLESLAAAVADAHPLHCARAFGCSAVTRVVEGVGIERSAREENDRVLAVVSRRVAPAAWTAAWEQGKEEDAVDLLRELAALPPVGTPTA